MAFAHQDQALPLGCNLRPATPADFLPICRLVLGAMLDLTQLRSHQFWVVDRGGEIIACGQLRRFEAAQELGSLVVKPGWRGQGIGRLLGQHLIRQADQPLYLECLGLRLVAFYTKLGFAPAAWDTLPPALRQKFRLSHWAARWLGLPIYLMQYGPDGGPMAD